MKSVAKFTHLAFRITNATCRGQTGQSCTDYQQHRKESRSKPTTRVNSIQKRASDSQKITARRVYTARARCCCNGAGCAVHRAVCCTVTQHNTRTRHTDATHRHTIGTRSGTALARLTHTRFSSCGPQREKENNKTNKQKNAAIRNHGVRSCSVQPTSNQSIKGYKWD